MNIELIPGKKQITASIKVPGSKSYTNRALILAALTKGKVEIINPLFSEDTKAMISSLIGLGINISVQKQKIIVDGDISSVKNRSHLLDANLSATTIRFLTSVSCILPGIKTLTGKQALLERPIKDLVDGLVKLGAEISYLNREGFPPIRISSTVLKPREIRIKGRVSSQFLSSILMVAPKIGNLVIKVDELSSKPYVEMTLDLMGKFGLVVKNNEGNKFFIEHGQTYKASKVFIEGDFSSATYFAAIACLKKNKIKLENLKGISKQADSKFFDILEMMGNKITRNGDSIIVEGKRIKPVNIDMVNCPDSILTLSVLSAFAKGKTKISGIQTLKYKETDRLKAVRTELKKMEIKTEVRKNTLIIYGGNPKPAVIKTYNDHRMAMSFAVAGSILRGMEIENPDVVNKTFPDFWKEMQKLGIKVKKTKPTKIVLVGFMGAGKSSVAPMLGRKLKKGVMEMDDLVKKISKRDSVLEIFIKDGEKKFRGIEQKVAKNLRDNKDIVVSTGGGVVINDTTMENLKKNGLIVFLDANLDTIKKRLTKVNDRPLLVDNEKTEELFKSRLSLYHKFADIIIKTDGKSLSQVTEEIVDKFEKI